MQTPGLNHDILTVSNTEPSRAFHGDLLNFTGIVIEEDQDKNVFLSVSPAGSERPHQRISDQFGPSGILAALIGANIIGECYASFDL